jgi:hypothetical protein
LAQATDSDLAQAAEVAGATLRGFGLEAQQTAHLTDVMAKAFSSTPLDIGNFQDAMKYVAPVAREAGVSVEQTTALLGQLAASGIKGSQAGTSLRVILQELGKDGGDVATKLKALSERGLTLGSSMDEVGRRASTALLVLGRGTEDLDGMTEALENADGAAKGMADIMNEGATGAFKRLGSAVEGAQIAFGEALAPTIIAVADFVANLATQFAELGPEMQTTIATIAAIVAGIGPALIAIGAMIAAYGQLKIALASATAMQIKQNLAVLANPYVAAGAAIAAAAYALYRYVNAKEKEISTEERLDGIRQNAVSGMEEERSSVQLLLAKYKLYENNLEERQKILDELHKIAPDTIGDLDAEKTGYDDLKKSVQEYLKVAQAKAIFKAYEDEFAKVTVALSEQKDALAEAQAGLQRYGTSLAAGMSAEEQIATFGAVVRFDPFDPASVEAFADQANTDIADALAPDEFDVPELDYGPAIEGFVAQSLESAQSASGEITKLESELDAITNRMNRAIDEFGDVLLDTGGGGGGGGNDKVKQSTKELVDILKDGSEEITDILLDLSEQEGQIAGVFELDGDEDKRIRAMADAYREAAEAAAGIGELEVAKELDAQAQAFDKLVQKADLSKRSFDNLQAIARDTGIAFVTLAQGGVTDLMNALENFGTDTRTKLKLTADAIKAFSIQVRDAFIQLAVDLASSFGSVIERVQQGYEVATALKEVAGQVLSGLFETLGQIAIQVGKTTLATGAAVEAIKKALKSLNGVVAIVAGAALIALGSVVRAKMSNISSGIPALAQGGITTGPTLSLIGDNPSGREAVIPFERMGEFIRMAGANLGGGSQQLTATIKGQDLLLSNQRAQYNYNRLR